MSSVPIINVPSHSKHNVIEWKFVFHRKIVYENELLENDQKRAKIMELLSDVNLMKVMIGIGPYYPMLVNEFVMNLPTSLNILESSISRKACEKSVS